MRDILPTWLYHILDWPMNTGRDGGYNFWSGIGVSVFWPLMYWRRHNCHRRGCWRLQWHVHPDDGMMVCRKHHPHP